MFLVAALAACGSDKAKAPAGDSPATDSPPTAPAPGPEPGSSAAAAAAPAQAAGTGKRAELQGLAATVEVPAAAKVEMAEASNPAMDGFSYLTPIARISGAGLPGIIEISTGAQLGWTPTTLAGDLAEVARLKHENVASVERNGNWAAAYKLTDSCYIHAWSPAARLWCTASAEGDIGVPCDQVSAAMDVCVTIAPGGAAAAPRVNAAVSFPDLKDEKAIETAIAAGRAVAADDRAAFAGLLTPGKIQLRKKKVDAAGFEAAVAKAGSLSRLLGNDCVPGPEHAGSPPCSWNSSSDGADGKLAISSHDGYGVVPTIELVRQDDGSWRVAGFGEIDLGEP